MQAIILAAGMGKRLKELTRDNTKCMVKVNGVTLIDRMLHQIERLGLSRIVIVVGYHGQTLRDYIDTLGIQTPIVYIENPIYNKTNNIYSLALAKEWLCKEDTLLFESDLIFEDSVLDTLVSDPEETLVLVDHYESWMDGTCVTLAEDDSIRDFINSKHFAFDAVQSYYKTVNIYKFSRHFSRTHYVPFLEAYQIALGQNEYYEQVLRVITMLDSPKVKAKRLSGQKWYEIDDVQDLDIAESMFADDAERVKLMMGRYGGFWRYPKLLDFCYLVNPYFPTQKMKLEMQANFDALLTSYPSGMRVLSLLAAKHFALHPQNILTGNGAAELIRSLMGCIEGNTGMIRPTFDEYPNRCDSARIVCYTPNNPDFTYTADDLIAFFSDKDIQNLLIVNPDNPSGSYINQFGLRQMIAWTKERGIRLMIDESFVDFADETENTLLVQHLLEENPHLFVIKSISKSYGVPGIRLGVLATGDTEMLERVKRDLPIWNINSFGEFFLQISGKYQNAYADSLVQIKAERARLTAELDRIRGVRAIPSQANYIMVELDKDISQQQLIEALLTKHNLLIKGLAQKTNGGNYLRLAVRNTEENDRLIRALKAELES